jgi:signal transduction histidine kinase
MPNREREGRRASAALVLGVLSGALAALTVLPTIIPLTYRVVSSAEAAEVNRLRAAAAALGLLVESDVPVPDGTTDRLMLSGLQVRTLAGSVSFSEGRLPTGVDPLPLCQETFVPHRFEDTHGEDWSFACQKLDRRLIVVAHRPEIEGAAYVAYLVLGLAAMVGISTALGVLQLLSPLSELSRALTRVGAGERGVRVADTGFSELDELAERLNAAARAMEDREEAIEARIRVVQELARMVAHEIRNPLQSLELLTSLIASESDRPEREGLAQSIHNEIRSLDAVVTRLLKDSEGHIALRPDRSLTSLRDLIEHVVAFRKFEARRQGTRLEVAEVVDRMLPIDRTLVSRALENLIINAMQAVPATGGRVCVGAFETDTHLCLLVDDNGTGVSEALGNSIYEPDVTSRAKGTGLGLALVKGVMHAHGGYVDHGRSPMGGARFRAWLPLHEHAEPEEVSRADSGGGRQPLKR